ncbi:MAG: protein kinase [Leptolyngbyaceae cyanobacterium]
MPGNDRVQTRCSPSDRRIHLASTPRAIMALCINPTCSSPNHPDNAVHSHCQACGATLTLQGRYRVMRLLTDRSGFGRVYEIFERDQPKILKVLKETYNGNAKAIQLFEQEALVLSHLDHPGVPRIDVDGCFQVIPREGAEPLHCLVMEKVDGPNLSEWMRQQGNHPISERQAVQWLQQLIEVLHLVHQQRYFHRDIKPDNIMLRSSGQLVLVDFGAVREMSFTYFEQLEATGGITRISSAGYTPPEQERGQAVPQSDFFSLGCTFMYLLTGKKPTDVDIYRSMTNEYHWRPFAPHISPQLADFIDRLTAPRVVDRPTSTLELLAKVRQLQLALDLPPQGSDLNQELGVQRQVGEKWRNPVPLSFPSPPPNAVPHNGQAAHYPVAGDPSADQLITLPPSYAAAEFPDAISSTAPTQSQAATTPPPPLTAQPYEIYESSTIPPDAEPYPESPDLDTLAQNAAASFSTTKASSPLSSLRSWHWFGLGLGLVALTGAAIWGGRSLYQSLSEPPPTIPERPTANTEPFPTHDQILSFTQGSPLEGHAGAINALALTLDGQTLVSAGNDRIIRVWDMATGEEQQQLVGHPDLIHAVALSPNGQLVASGGGGTVIKLWDMNTGEAIADLIGHASSINDLMITPDGQTLISSSADKTIKLWNLATLAKTATLTGHNSYVNQISLSPDGTLLASSSADGTVKLWNLASQQPLATLTDHTSPVNTVIFSHDGSRLISGGADNHIKIWNLTTYQLVATLKQHTHYINSLEIAPGGQLLVSASADQTLIVWDLTTKQPIQTIPWANTFIETVAIRINGATWQLIAGGAGDHKIQVWEIDR